ncbi:MAG: [protein-PII] uridylyltransferase [Magnetococcales bacterium]|nr:[protein-PII] uridylyltransferase [Magnetococcales bacterium]
MSRRFTRKDIIDAKALDAEIAGIDGALGGSFFSGDKRAKLLELFRRSLAEGRNELHRSHLQGAPGRFIVLGHTHLMDTLLQKLHSVVLADQPGVKGKWFWLRRAKREFSLVATGGYGRRELAPYSDIDLLFLMPEGKGAHLAESVEKMLYFLWDLGIDLGHAVRRIPECVEQAKKELEVRTSLLESRFLAGDEALFESYHATLTEKVLDKDPEGFQRGKLVEQSKRHERFGNSLFYLEPNIKENPGGLRDIQTFFWISKYRYRVSRPKELIANGFLSEQEYRVFSRSHAFLLRVRNALHYRAGRRDDRLTFHHQLEIAQEFGYRDRPGFRGVEQFMRRYYQVVRLVGNLSWIFLEKYKEEHRRSDLGVTPLEGPFILEADKVAVSHSKVFSEDPNNLMRLFEVAQRYVRSIHPETLRLAARDVGLIDRRFRESPETSALFLKMLNGKQAVAWVLRRMNSIGMLGRYLPEFGRVIGQTQHDLFHVYTVDEHTILAVEALRNLKAGKLQKELPLPTKLMRQVQNPVLLYLGVLCHDIAKGQGGDHQIKGAAQTRTICHRLSLSDQDTDMVTWLVGNHLLFSRTAFHRDINDPGTIVQFARKVGQAQRLDLLLLLTIADIQAVGPGIWTPWKATLLLRLHSLALETLTRGLFTYRELKQRALGIKRAVLKLLGPEGKTEMAENHLARFPVTYFTSHDPQTLASHYRALAPLMDHPLAVVFQTRPDWETTEMLIHTQDHPGLMAKISGALAVENVNILNASINTAQDGMVLDVFILQEMAGGPIVSTRKLDQIEKTLRRILTGQARPEDLIAHYRPPKVKGNTFQIPTSVVADNSFHAHTVLEITALDRVGLLFTMTRVLESHGIQISTAKIATYGERAVDVFYVRDLFGLKLEPRRLDPLIQGLRDAVDGLADGLGPKSRGPAFRTSAAAYRKLPASAAEPPGAAGSPETETRKATVPESGAADASSPKSVAPDAAGPEGVPPGASSPEAVTAVGAAPESVAEGVAAPESVISDGRESDSGSGGDRVAEDPDFDDAESSRGRGWGWS